MAQHNYDADEFAELRQIYLEASVLEFEGRLITVNAFTDQIKPLSPTVLGAIARTICAHLNNVSFDFVLGEEDKGAHIATAVSMQTGKPLVLARWYVYPLEAVSPSSIVVPIDSEYYRGNLLVNGIKSGDRVALVEDTISTGGTLISMINAVHRAGAHVAAVIAVVEKVGVGGKDRVLKETGIKVESLLRIHVTTAGVTVVN